jgi:AcrR family transcriptional regulator
MIDGVTASPQPRTMNERVVSAAAELTCEVGWSGVTMAKLADRVGVSRQTVYNEMGSKPALAEAMVLRELATFLAAVDRAFDRHPDDLVEAIRAAVTDVLVEAERNALLQAVVSSAYGAETDLLPLLTTESDPLVETAKQVVAARLDDYEVGVDHVHLGAAIDMVVRTVLSHVIQPSGCPEDTAEGIAWLAGRALRAN